MGFGKSLKKSIGKALGKSAPKVAAPQPVAIAPAPAPPRGGMMARKAMAKPAGLGKAMGALSANSARRKLK
jgi:hypothetical protein